MKEENAQEIPLPEVLLSIGITVDRGREGSSLSGYAAWVRLVGCFENIQN